MKTDYVSLWRQMELTMAAASLIGAGLAAGGTAGQMILHGKSNKKTREWNERMYGVQRKDALADWNRTNAYNSAQAQKERLKAAGMNPALMYGMSGGGGVSAQEPRGADVKPWNPEIPNVQGMGIQAAQMIEQLALLKAQKENIEADTANKQANTTKTSTVDTEQVKANIENTILEGVIKKYAGKEAQETFERVKSPNRGIEAKTYQDELEARQGVAGTIYEMWTQGKLAEMSLNQIEEVALKNSKSRAETSKIYKEIDNLEKQGKQLDLNNAILELEKNLQEKTGLDKNSAGWLKVLGRLFVTIMGQ